MDLKEHLKTWAGELEALTIEKAISLCMRVHYRIMDNPRFWYDPALIDASKMFCVAASNLRKVLSLADTLAPVVRIVEISRVV